MESGSTRRKASILEWLREHKVLVWVLILGTMGTLWIVPYHRVTAKAECRRLYGKAQTLDDTLRVDKTTVMRWNRFPGLRFRCEVFRV